MKKAMAFLAALGMTVSLVACGGSDSTSEVKKGNSEQKEAVKESNESGEEIVFWSMLGGLDGELMGSMIEEYNATNPKYKVKHYVQDWNEYYNKLTFAVASGEAPDVGLSHVTRLAQLADQQVIESLDEINGTEVIDWSDFVNDVDKTAQVNGTSYAVPLDFHGFLLFYNSQYLMDTGVISEKDELLEVKDFDDFKSILEKVSKLEVNTNDKKEDDVRPLALQTDGDFPYKIWYSFYLQQGGTPLLNEDGSELTMDDAAAEKAIASLLELYNTGYGGVFNNQWEDYKAGKAAFVMTFTGDVGSMSEALGEDMNVVRFPAFFGNGKTFADSHSFIFPVSEKRSAEKEAAIVDFVNWIIKSGKWMQTGHFPTVQSVYESEEYNNLPYVQNYKAALTDMTYMSASKNCWLISPPQTLQNFEQIYAERETIDPKDAAALIREGLEKDK